MQLTDTRGTAFLVNTKSVVYAKTRGSGATLLLSRGNQVVDVEETVAEVVTAADSDLTAFTAISGDVVGSVAINPDYIVSVSSYANGTQSQIVLLDDNENTTRVCMVVTTDFADMDDIIEPAAGGTSYNLYSALLSQSGTDAPVATVLENTLGGTVVWSYNSQGDYAATLTGAFPSGKTGVFMGNTNAAFWYGYRQSDNEVFIQTLNTSEEKIDEGLLDTIIEIRVYP